MSFSFSILQLQHRSVNRQFNSKRSSRKIQPNIFATTPLLLISYFNTLNHTIYIIKHTSPDLTIHFLHQPHICTKQDKQEEYYSKHCQNYKSCCNCSGNKVCFFASGHLFLCIHMLLSVFFQFFLIFRILELVFLIYHTNDTLPHGHCPYQFLLELLFYIFPYILNILCGICIRLVD